MAGTTAPIGAAVPARVWRTPAAAGRGVSQGSRRCRSRSRGGRSRDGREPGYSHPPDGRGDVVADVCRHVGRDGNGQSSRHDERDVGRPSGNVGRHGDGRSRDGWVRHCPGRSVPGRRFRGAACTRAGWAAASTAVAAAAVAAAAVFARGLFHLTSASSPFERGPHPEGGPLRNEVGAAAPSRYAGRRAGSRPAVVIPRQTTPPRADNRVLARRRSPPPFEDRHLQGLAIFEGGSDVRRTEHRPAPLHHASKSAYLASRRCSSSG